MLDFCCYGATGSRWFVGQRAVSAIGLKANLDSQYGDAEDNAAILVRYPEAMAIIEGSWTTADHGLPTGPIVYGTTGTLVVEGRGGEERVRVERGGGRQELHRAEPLPTGRENIAQELIHHLETGEPLHPTLDAQMNLEVTAILDAGVRSAESGCVELVNNATWSIG